MIAYVVPPFTDIY